MVKLNVVMLSVVMLNAVMLNAVMLSVVMLRVVAPSSGVIRMTQCDRTTVPFTKSATSYSLK
jgi:hypothetical protein